MSSSAWHVRFAPPLVFIAAATLALASCGSSGSTTSAVGDPASDATATTGPVAGSAFDGTYTVTGTMECVALGAQAGPGSAQGKAPIPAGSSFTVEGDHVTMAGFSNPPQTVLRVVSLDPFHISATYADDHAGGFTTVVPAGTPPDLTWTVDFTDSSADGGATITGTDSDSGVNCGYDFTASKATASGGDTSIPSPAPSSVPSSEPHTADPSCDQTAIFAAVRAEVHDASPSMTLLSCSGSWAVVEYGVGDEGDRNGVAHWDGQAWQPDGRGVCTNPDVPTDVHFLACEVG